MEYLDVVNRLLVTILVILMFIDVITGVIKSYVVKDVASSSMYVGLAKKVMTLILIIAVLALDVAMVMEGNLVNGSVLIYCAYELLSIIENAGAVGVPIPQKIRDAIRSLQGE